jgi:tRNA(adenine34) deaminase
MDDEFFMREALELAHRAWDCGEVPVGAVVVRDGEIIGRGFNRPISSSDPTAHAEIIAMRDAALRIGNYRLAGCELFVTLEPCAMCAGAIMHARVRRLVFGTSDPKTGACGSVTDLFSLALINHHTEVISCLLSDDCGDIIKRFFEEKRSRIISNNQG